VAAFKWVGGWQCDVLCGNTCTLATKSFGLCWQPFGPSRPEEISACRRCQSVRAGCSLSCSYKKGRVATAIFLQRAREKSHRGLEPLTEAERGPKPALRHVAEGHRPDYGRSILPHAGGAFRLSGDDAAAANRQLPPSFNTPSLTFRRPLAMREHTHNIAAHRGLWLKVRFMSSLRGRGAKAVQGELA
jgi:hypothetical protein